MVQYYIPIVINSYASNMIAAYSIYDFKKDTDIGGLTSHAHINSPFVDNVLTNLFENKCCLAWVGEYARRSNKYTDHISQLFFELRDQAAMNRYIFHKRDAYINSNNLIFINHTKKEYLNMKEYIANVKALPLGEYTQRLIILGMLNYAKIQYLHPIPILTAIGNGLGAGDYSGINMDKVGSWAGDLISAERYLSNRYSNYTNISNIVFSEDVDDTIESIDDALLNKI